MCTTESKNYDWQGGNEWQCEALGASVSHSRKVDTNFFRRRALYKCHANGLLHTPPFHITDDLVNVLNQIEKGFLPIPSELKKTTFGGFQDREETASALERALNQKFGHSQVRKITGQSALSVLNEILKEQGPDDVKAKRLFREIYYILHPKKRPAVVRPTPEQEVKLQIADYKKMLQFDGATEENKHKPYVKFMHEGKWTTGWVYKPSEKLPGHYRVEVEAEDGDGKKIGTAAFRLDKRLEFSELYLFRNQLIGSSSSDYQLLYDERTSPTYAEVQKVMKNRKEEIKKKQSAGQQVKVAFIDDSGELKRCVVEKLHDNDLCTFHEESNTSKKHQKNIGTFKIFVGDKLM